MSNNNSASKVSDCLRSCSNVKKIITEMKLRRKVLPYLCKWSDNSVLYYTCADAHLKM